MKILITGGCGFIGSNIAIFLKKRLKKANIFTLDNLIRKGSKLNKARLLKSSIKNFRFDIINQKKILHLRKFDLIIDCCAEPAIEASRKNPDIVFNTNLIGTFNVLKKCIKDNSDLIFLSSSRVYSIANLRNIKKNFNFKKEIKIKEKINENFETTLPSSLYGFTKLASEKLIKEMFFNRKMKYLINRFGVVAGPWQFGKQDQGFVPLWVARHLYMKKLSYIGFGGHGNQIRDIIHIDDLCEIILRQIKNFNKIKNTTFNIGGGKKNSISLKNLTLKCRKITDNEIKINRVSKTSQFDIPYYVTDNKKVEKYYSWRPKKNVDQIIKDIYQWLLKNKKVKKYFK
tara:strand:+ start:3339 stop:4367 length:1029 start_codon:yes stop_codon:yes gene_type:complete